MHGACVANAAPAPAQDHAHTVPVQAPPTAVDQTQSKLNNMNTAVGTARLTEAARVARAQAMFDQIDTDGSDSLSQVRGSPGCIHRLNCPPR